MKRTKIKKNVIGLIIVFLMGATLCFSEETVLIGVNEYTHYCQKNWRIMVLLRVF
jgi:hypothetical protein